MTKPIFEVETTKDGKIKAFSVPDAHSFYVKAYMRDIPKPIRSESIVIPSLDFLDQLPDMVDAEDGFKFGQKWALNPEVIKELKSKGEAQQAILGHPLRFEYFIRKTKHADELKHKG